jgi:hypothetical protein
MLTKHNHWHTRHFHDFLYTSADKPFKWGEWDCALFAADAIKSFTDVDLADDFRGKYTTQTGAFKLIKKLTGGTTVADAAAYCAQKHSLEEHTYPLMCKRGDLVVFDNGGDLISGVVHLSGRHVVSVSDSGLVRLPITTVKRSWSV